MAVILLVEENRVPGICIEYTSPWSGFKLTTLMVIGTDCTGSCKSNYHTMMTTTASQILYNNQNDIIWNLVTFKSLRYV